MLKIQLINIGRNKINQTCLVKDEEEILTEVKRHLLSQDVWLCSTKETDLYQVNAGVHSVGKVKILDRTFQTKLF